MAFIKSFTSCKKNLKIVLKFILQFLPPANEVCEGYVFTGVCPREGACMAGGGMCGRGMHGRGACMAGGMHGGGHAWQEGMCGRGACMAGGMHGGYYEVRSRSGRCASYWNAFLLSMRLIFSYQVYLL